MAAGGMGEPWRLELQLSEAAGITTMTFIHHLAGDHNAGDIGPGWEFYADRPHAHFNGNDMPDWNTDGYLEHLGPHYLAQ